jgi:hypothetical protein
MSKFNQLRTPTTYLCILHNQFTVDGVWKSAKEDACAEVKKITRKVVITQCPTCIRMQRRKDAFLSGMDFD